MDRQGKAVPGAITAYLHSVSRIGLAASGCAGPVPCCTGQSALSQSAVRPTGTFIT